MLQENVDLVNDIFVVLYQAEGADALSGEPCIDGNNRTNIPIPNDERVRHTAEVRTTQRSNCITNNGTTTATGSAIAGKEIC